MPRKVIRPSVGHVGTSRSGNHRQGGLVHATDHASSGLDGGCSLSSRCAAQGREILPERIALPDGFRPEGIAISRGGTFYVGSVRQAPSTGSLITGEGETIFVGGADRKASVGIELHGGRLYVAGGRRGAVLSAAPGAAACSNVSLHHRGDDVRERRGRRAWRRVLHRLSASIPLPRARSDATGKGHHGHGNPREATAMPLSGAIVYGEQQRQRHRQVARQADADHRPDQRREAVHRQPPLDSGARLSSTSPS